MSSLTRWVLAHKRLVIIGWIGLTIAGIAAAGPASGLLTNGGSVPDREGWETTVDIAKRYDDKRGESSDRWTGALHPLGALFVLVLAAELVRRDANSTPLRRD